MRFLIIALAIIFGETYVSAQSFTDRLRRQKKEEGSIIIYQEQYLTHLLNGRSTPEAANKQKETTEKDTSTKSPSKEKSKNRHNPANEQTQTSINHNNRVAIVKDIDTSVISPSGSQKKIFKNSTTANGYRIRLYVGGSSREARQKAYSVGYLFKSVYMDIPVYTHFYSPHWMCSAGNFKTYEEASQFLAELKTTKQFDGAMIVKSRIQIEQ